MSKRRKFVTGCCIAVGMGLLLIGAGLCMGGSVIGVGWGSRGLIINTFRNSHEESAGYKKVSA